jgi:hypothetical protein
MKKDKQPWERKRSDWNELQYLQKLIRVQGYLERIANKETMADIARSEGISRQKVHALIASVK